MNNYFMVLCFCAGILVTSFGSSPAAAGGAFIASGLFGIAEAISSLKHKAAEKAVRGGSNEIAEGASGGAS